MIVYTIITFFFLSIFFLTAGLVAAKWSVVLFAAIGVGCLGWVIFKDSMNLVQSVGRVYWIIRNNAKKGDRIVSTAFMRGTDEPWLIGEGIQFRFFKYTFHIGLCYPVPADSEEEGVLNAMQGRYMEEPAKEIGNWR